MPSHDASRPFVVLGAGPAGLAAAFKLAQRGWRDATVFERVCPAVVRKRLVSPPREPSFASILEHGLGRTICRDFYFPYARRIWGLDPAAFDPEQAPRQHWHV
jgi:2-polyprenyl-6-methoxyphenol hydroxylase-like FAD-dependent oxidoreductase